MESSKKGERKRTARVFHSVSDLDESSEIHNLFETVSLDKASKKRKKKRKTEAISDSDSDLDYSKIMKTPCSSKGKNIVNLTREEIVHENLKKMGIKRPVQASKCVKRAIYNGFIKITGDPKDLETVVFKGKGRCGHVIEATLRNLLVQPDFVNLKYEAGLPNATVFCEYLISGDKISTSNLLIEDPDHNSRCSSQEGRMYVTQICTGNPKFDSGSFHRHCSKCPDFGLCGNCPHFEV